MIRKRRPDKPKAQSMIKAAIHDMQFISTLPLSKEGGQTIIRGIYENFRMLGDALLIAEGKEALGVDHHTEMINTLTTLSVKTQRSLLLLDELRKLRHKINYQGYEPSEKEVAYVIQIKKDIWNPVLGKVKEKIEG